MPGALHPEPCYHPKVLLGGPRLLLQGGGVYQHISDFIPCSVGATRFSSTGLSSPLVQVRALVPKSSGPVLKPLELGRTFKRLLTGVEGGTQSPPGWIHWFSSGWRCLHTLELVRLAGSPIQSCELAAAVLAPPSSPSLCHPSTPAPAQAPGLRPRHQGCCQHLQIHMGMRRGAWEQAVLWVTPGGVGKVGKAAVGTAGVGAAQQGLVLGRFVLLCAQQLLLSWVTMAG